jgi:hypothetical protein
MGLDLAVALVTLLTKPTFRERRIHDGRSDHPWLLVMAMAAGGREHWAKADQRSGKQSRAWLGRNEATIGCLRLALTA